jgi:hypothetical protein
VRGEKEELNGRKEGNKGGWEGIEKSEVVLEMINEVVVRRIILF